MLSDVIGTTQRLTETERFARFAHRLSDADIPAEVREAARLHVLDMIGCGLAGYALDAAPYGFEAAQTFGAGGPATTIGMADGARPLLAAFANGVLCHCLDFDDTHPAAISHVTTVVAPAALAVAEETGASGRDVLSAIVLGCELAIRIGAAAPGQFHERGLHVTSLAGVFGAAIAVARLTGLSEAEMVHALGVAGSMASGNLEYLDAGTETKPVHAGWAALGGVMAAWLARAGAPGPASVLAGRFGIYAAYLGRPETDAAVQFEDLGERWETPRMAYKLFPACHFIHGCLGAAEQATGGAALAPEQIVDVTLTLPAEALPIIVEPVAAKRAPRTPYDAKFSVQYSVAAMLVHGRVTLSSYTPTAIVDPQVLDVAARVQHEVKSFSSFPGAFPGGVRVRLSDGRELFAELDYQPGAPENPASPEVVRNKYRANAELALEQDDIEALERFVLDLDDERDVAAGLAPLRRARVGSSAVDNADGDV